MQYKHPVTNLSTERNSSSTNVQPSFRLTSRINWFQSRFSMGKPLMESLPVNSPPMGSEGGPPMLEAIGGSNVGDQSQIPGAGCSNAETSLHTSSR